MKSKVDSAMRSKMRSKKKRKTMNNYKTANYWTITLSKNKIMMTLLVFDFVRLFNNLSIVIFNTNKIYQS